MKIVYCILLFIPCVIIAIQDFKDREVSVLWLIVIAVLSLVLHQQSVSLVSLWRSVSTNFLVLLFQLCLLHLYFWIRERKLSFLIDTKIGWGDILFLLAPMFFFSPVHFLLFYVSSLFAVLVISLLIQLKNKHFQYIPLAGGQAVAYFVYIVSCYCIRQSPFIDPFI